MSEVEDFRKSGKISAQIREYAKSICKEGILHRELADKVEAKIRELGGKPAFPMDVSVNSMAAHDCPFPNDDRKIKKSDIVKLDMGVHVNGCVTDTACTIEAGTNNHKKLIEASEKALEEAVKLAKEVGTKLCDIGKAISEIINNHGFTPITNLSGHGVGVYIVHDKPTVPNYNNNDQTKLLDGQRIAIEPFATTGAGKVNDGKPAGIYRLVNAKPVRLMSARKLIEYVAKEYNTLPFAARWLNFPNTIFLLRLLEKEDVLHQYTQLPESSGGIVSQFEHTVEVGYGVLTK